MYVELDCDMSDTYKLHLELSVILQLELLMISRYIAVRVTHD